VLIENTVSLSHQTPGAPSQRVALRLFDAPSFDILSLTDRAPHSPTVPNCVVFLSLISSTLSVPMSTATTTGGKRPLPASSSSSSGSSPSSTSAAEDNNGNGAHRLALDSAAARKLARQLGSQRAGEAPPPLRCSD
jgi:hypothetical protein